MRGRERDGVELARFVAARSPDLYRDAFQLTGSQHAAEHLVAAVLAGLQHDRVDLSRAAATVWLRMARAAARDERSPSVIDPDLPARFRSIASLSSRQRAALVLHVLAGYDDRPKPAADPAGDNRTARVHPIWRAVQRDRHARTALSHRGFR